MAKSKRFKVAKLNVQTQNETTNPYQEKGLCRKTTFKNEIGEEIVIDFDDLERVKVLGSGSFGIVLKFKHKISQLELAAKRINCISKDDLRKKEIMDLEVPLKAGQSEFIVKFYGGLLAEGFIWILTELMDASLDKFYEQSQRLNKKLEESFLSRIAYSTLKGIDFLKSNEIMHRDIKPSNMLINRAGKIKLCDFGISGFINGQICLTNNGTNAYVAPEKISGNKGYTLRSDIWSLGMSLLEIATFNHPFSDADSICKLQLALGDYIPILPDKEYSENFCSFLKKCLIKDPNERGDLGLLEHEFIIKYLNDEIELAYVGEILDILNNIDPESTNN